MKKTALGLSLIFSLLFSVAAVLLLVNSATAFYGYLPTITIKSDGSIEPETELINKVGNIYTLTSIFDQRHAIRIECSNIVFDGAGQIINGSSKKEGILGAANIAFHLIGVTNVTVRNIEVSDFINKDFVIENSSRCTIVRVKARISRIVSSDYNTISESTLGDEHYHLFLSDSNHNTITKSDIWGVGISSGHSNVFFENNFAKEFLYPVSEANFWDNGYVGNYWGDYLTKYPSASEIGNTGIGDTPYIIDADNIDYYPLMAPVDNTAPAIEILSPALGTYNASSILLNFTVDDPASLMAYSLDGKENITITRNITLTGLANGVHDLTIYAKDKAGNTGASETIYFSVEVPEPFPTTLVATASAASAAVIGVALLVYFKKRKR